MNAIIFNNEWKLFSFCKIIKNNAVGRQNRAKPVISNRDIKWELLFKKYAIVKTRSISMIKTATYIQYGRIRRIRTVYATIAIGSRGVHCGNDSTYFWAYEQF